LKAYGEIDNKFIFVILAAKRAKQLLHGAKPKIKSKSKNPILVAQKEVRDGLVDYEIVEPQVEEIHEPADEGFIGEEIGVEEEIEEKKAADTVKKKQKKSDEKPKKDVKKKPVKDVKKKPVKDVKKKPAEDVKKKPVEKKKSSKKTSK